MDNDFETVSTDQLDHVTGGGWMGDAWNWVKNTAGNLFGGSGINVNAQIGNNQRSAQGNTGPVSLGDNSPVTVNR